MSIDTDPCREQLMELWAVVMTQITKLKIYGSETIHQTDRVIEGSYEFVEQCCEVVGYFTEEEQEDSE